MSSHWGSVITSLCERGYGSLVYLCHAGVDDGRFDEFFGGVEEYLVQKADCSYDLLHAIKVSLSDRLVYTLETNENCRIAVLMSLISAIVLQSMSSRPTVSVWTC